MQHRDTRSHRSRSVPYTHLASDHQRKWKTHNFVLHFRNLEDISRNVALRLVANAPPICRVVSALRFRTGNQHLRLMNLLIPIKMHVEQILKADLRKDRIVYRTQYKQTIYCCDTDIHRPLEMLYG